MSNKLVRGSGVSSTGKQTGAEQKAAVMLLANEPHLKRGRGQIVRHTGGACASAQKPGLTFIARQ